jgi:hypothetical protein
MLTTSKYTMHDLVRGVHSVTTRFVPARATLNFGGQQTVSTSVPSFARMMLTKRVFACSMPSRLPMLRRKQCKAHRDASSLFKCRIMRRVSADMVLRGAP